MENASLFYKNRVYLELIFRKKYATMEEVKTDLYRYIELFYNRKRLHSTLGYMSPVAYRLAFMQ